MSDALLDEIRAIIQRDVNNRGLARDPHDNLFTACRDDFANACRSIAETSHPAISVFTGFFILHAQPPCAETDGPLGALFLARAGQALGIGVGFWTDGFCRHALEIGLKACDLDTSSGIQAAVGTDSVPNLRVNPSSILVLPAEGPLADPNRKWRLFFPFYHSGFYGPPISKRFFLALERVGPGRDGRCRNMHGRDVTDEMNPAYTLFEDATAQNPRICTIGIGDGGNEIGMGKIPPEVIARNIPHGEQIACRFPTDHLIVAGVSNWGAYALAAGIAVLRRQRLPASLFDVERERELLRVMVEQGPLVDGVTARQTVTVDGLAFDDYAEPLRRIGELLERERWLT